ncbi:hypothetical protein SAMN04488005_1769 [Yoonia tamlensis]|uniref:Uncharacterized protein n=1 Tax=Yoonia tamlensis TaxID=390270 RepID=A0A1I6GJQ7_9RHOB|nr:hypothetical protein [Yoonia tamlensis]SFR42386.1 hypothetical protein SAMN04488005_1769 [Yoonia tamlensis]
MSFSWPTLAQATYRIMRLRRLILTALVLSATVLCCAAVIAPELLTAARILRIFAAIALLLCLHVMLFPNVALETLSLSVVGTGFATLLPVLPDLAGFAPITLYQAALTFAAVLAVLLALACTMVVHKFLEICVYAGPTVHLRLRTALWVPHAPEFAHRQFGLRPDTRRGRVMAGPVDDHGFFDVAVVSSQMADPADPSCPLVVKLDAKILSSDGHTHKTMLVLPDGAVTVTAQRFTPLARGCTVTVTEVPGDFTYGMYALFWLTDQQTDNLVEVAELLQSDPPRANGLAHAVSFLSLAGVVLSPRQPLLH